MELKGWRTYATATALFLIGMAGYIDPSIAEFIGEQLGFSPESILLICGAIMAALRKFTNTPGKV